MSELIVIILYLYASITMLYSGLIFIPTGYSWQENLNTSEKFSLALFWPIYLILWLCISVPKNLWSFINNLIRT